MNNEDSSRRSFLGASVSAWLATSWPGILAAQNHAHKVAQSAAPAKLEFFSPEQAVEIDALAAQIIPTDDTPGAREARILYFIDRAVTTFDHSKQPDYTQGLKDLEMKQRELFA